MATTQRVADDDDAFVLDEGLNEADEELVAFGATGAVASGGVGRPAVAGATDAVGGGGGGGTTTAAAKAAAAPGATTAASAGDANGSTRKEPAGDGDAAAAAAAAPADGAAAPHPASPPPGSGLHGVVVSNVAGDAHTEELLEILACCGALVGSAFERLDDGTLVGMALFDEPEAVDAALTLDGSRFQGRTLSVVRERGAAAAPTAAAALAALPGLVRQHRTALAAGASAATPADPASSAAAAANMQAALRRSVAAVGEESRPSPDRARRNCGRLRLGQRGWCRVVLSGAGSRPAVIVGSRRDRAAGSSTVGGAFCRRCASGCTTARESPRSTPSCLSVGLLGSLSRDVAGVAGDRSSSMFTTRGGRVG